MSPGQLPAPFFVVGAQRSGTTLLRLMLDHHPSIRVPHEFDFAVEWVTAAGTWPPLEDYYARLAEHGSFRRSGLEIDPELDYPQLVESFLRQRQGDRPLVGMAVHVGFDRLLHFWPEARFVHLLRDPRDVASSVVGMGWAGTVWHGAARWVEAEESWDRLCARVPEASRMAVRYEALVAEPVRELERVCAFLGVPFDEAMIRYDEDTTYEAPDAKLASRWQSRLSPTEIRLVERRVGTLLADRGYVSSGLAPIEPGLLRRATLALRDRLGALRFRIRRYGARDVLTRAIASRLGLRAAERAAAARMRAVADRYVR